MAPVENKRRLPNRFAEWEDKPVKDLDPEDEPPSESDGNSSEEESDGDDQAGTEHYVSVGKSKLRQKEAVSLGPEYRGARVSRSALEQESYGDDNDEKEEEGSEGSEEFDDPETADLDADHVDDDFEIDSDDALAESDEEKLRGFKFAGSKSKSKFKSKSESEVSARGRIKKRMTAVDFMSDSQEEEGSEDEEEEDEEDEEDEDEGDSEDESEAERNGALLFDDEAEEVSGEEEEDNEDEGDYNDEDEEDGDDDEEDEDDEGDDDEVGDRKPALRDMMPHRKNGKDGDGHSQVRDMMTGDQKSGKDNDGRSQIRDLVGNSEKIIVNTMSQKAKDDAVKGAAIRIQRRAFDSILNLRVRLQKALVATNTFSVLDDSHEAGSEPYQAAEEAALKLWNTIDTVRHSLLPDNKAKAGMKRKRSLDLDASSQEIWETMEEMESVATAKRRQILEKWSERLKKTAGTITKKRELIENTNQTLLSYLDVQMLDSDRLIKKARTPRSCAPAQAAKKVEEDGHIYDDADFYQLLLKELVDQRSVDTGAPGESVPTVRWAALNDAKTKKIVDRRASKGRKLRFTVHEKLQNFMAPEDRRSWEDHAIDRFFGTLFGQKMELKEDDVSDEEMGGIKVEEEGLKLFRS